MAEEKDNTEQVQKAKSNKTVLFVVIGAVVVIMILGGFLIGYLLMSGGDDSSQNQAQATQNQRPVSGNASKQSDYMNVGPLYPINPAFRVNLVSQNGRRYLLAAVTLELSSDKLKPEIDTKITIIQDTIIEILTSKSVEEIATTKGKEALKSEIVDRLNSFLVDGYIKHVFFTEFIVQ